MNPKAVYVDCETHQYCLHILNVFPPFQSFMLLYNFKGDFKINGGSKNPRAANGKNATVGTIGFQTVGGDRPMILTVDPPDSPKTQA